MLHLCVYLFLLKAFPSTINKVIENLNYVLYHESEHQIKPIVRVCLALELPCCAKVITQRHLMMVILPPILSEYVTAGNP